MSGGLTVGMTADLHNPSSDDSAATGDVIIVDGNTTGDLTLSNVRIHAVSESPLYVDPSAQLTLKLSGSNELKVLTRPGTDNPLIAALRFPDAITGSLEICLADGLSNDSDGKLTVEGGLDGGAGIGGGNGHTSGGESGNNISITSGTIAATAHGSCAAIGGGNFGGASNITITGGDVTATGGTGIGGAHTGDASNITITGNARVTATGRSGSGIGGGIYGSLSDLEISGSAEVTATSESNGTGIGAGNGNTLDDANASNIVIKNEAVVVARGAAWNAGIGAGANSTAMGIYIMDEASVTAVGGSNASGIGASYNGYAQNVTISGGCVSASAGDFTEAHLPQYYSSPSIIGSGTVVLSYGRPPSTVTITGGAFADASWSKKSVYGVTLGDGYAAAQNNDEGTKEEYPVRVYSSQAATLTLTPYSKNPVYSGTACETPSFTAAYGDKDATSTLAWRFRSTDDESAEWADGMPMDAGTYEIEASLPDNLVGSTYYEAATAFTTVTIDPAPLTVTANSAQASYGESAPSFSVTVTGWKASDESALLATLTGALSYSCDYAAGSPAGTYAVMPSWTGGAAPTDLSNYSVTLAPGSLVVGTVDPSITAIALDGEGAESDEFTYGEKLRVSATIAPSAPVSTQAAQANSAPGTASLWLGSTCLADGVAPTVAADGTYTFGFELDTTGKSLTVGTHVLTVRFDGDANMEAADASVTVTLAARTVRVTLTGDATKSYDGTNLLATGGEGTSLAAALTGTLDGDDVRVSASYRFDGADAGTCGVVATLSLLGDDAEWYDLERAEVATTVATGIVRATQAAPSGISVFHESAYQASDGRIAGLPSGSEWRAKGDGAWQATPASGTLEGLAPGTYEVRMAGDENHEPSDAVTIEVRAAQRSAGTGDADKGDADTGATREELAATGEPATLATCVMGLGVLLGGSGIALARRLRR